MPNPQIRVPGDLLPGIREMVEEYYALKDIAGKQIAMELAKKGKRIAREVAQKNTESHLLKEVA